MQQLFSGILLPFALVFVMFGMGLSLTIQDFKNIFRYPRSLIIGLVCQMLLLPLIAFGLAYISALPPAIQVGIVLIAACPGGAVSNLITHLLEANVALSVSLTTLNSFLVTLSIPTIVQLAIFFFMGQGDMEIKLSFWDTLFEILFLTLLPCLLGIYLRYRLETWANIVQRPMKFMMPFLLGIALLGAIFWEDGKHSTLPVFTEIIWIIFYVFLLNLLGLSLGYVLTGFLVGNREDQITIAVEVGLQNTALAITLATSPLFLHDKTMAIPASIYALFTFFTAALFGLLVKPHLLKSLFKRK